MDQTVAERMRRYRARLRGEDVPRRKPGRPSRVECSLPDLAVNESAAAAVTGDTIRKLQEKLAQPVEPSPWVSYTVLARDHGIKRGHLDTWVATRRVKTRNADDGSQEYLLADVLRERDNAR